MDWNETTTAEDFFISNGTSTDNVTNTVDPLGFIQSTVTASNTGTWPSWYEAGRIQIPFYAIIFILAVTGNLLVILTLVQNQRMRTITNLFLLNLAISDLLLGVLCMPFTLIGALLRDFVFGSVMCKLLPFLQEMESCCKAGETRTIVKQCKFTTKDGKEVDCECNCKCTCKAACEKCDCKCNCECSEATAKLGADGKYRCSCECQC